MLNSTGIKKSELFSGSQILANVDLQASVGCVVSSTLGVNGIVEAGTPIEVDFSDLTKAAVSGTANAILLHDVDVSDGDNNGTALIFGFVNKNRCSDSVQALLTNTQVGLVTILTI